MGWKTSCIIIPAYAKKDHKELLQNIGFSSFEQINDQPYDIAMYPNQDQVYIGSYKNNLIICSNDWPVIFFNDSISDFEMKLVTQFPDTEICAVSVLSTINHWGFALIKNGQKIRAKAGDADLGVIIDYGNPLEEEKTLLACSQIDSNGNRLYYLEGLTANPYREDQVGECFVFELFKRYTGNTMIEDDALLNTVFSGYQIHAANDNASLDSYR